MRHNKAELIDNFQYGIAQLSESLNCTEAEVVQKLSDRYDGYHFTGESDGLFNPFSILNAFKNNVLGSYWYASGTPKFLIEMLKRYYNEGSFDLDILDSQDSRIEESFEAPLEEQDGPLPLLYQAGYLTISGYDAESDTFTLGIPNAEVRIGLMQNLMPLYSNANAKNVLTTAARTVDHWIVES